MSWLNDFEVSDLHCYDRVEFRYGREKWGEAPSIIHVCLECEHGLFEVFASKDFHAAVELAAHLGRRLQILRRLTG